MAKLGTRIKSNLNGIAQPGGAYVYFTSLWNKEGWGQNLAKSAEDYLFQLSDPSGKTLISAHENIKVAFNWLDKVITSERAKENAFVNYLSSKIKGKLKIDIPAIDQDWAQFTVTMQQLLNSGGLETSLKHIENEINRLETNRKKNEENTAAGKQVAYALKSDIAETANDLKSALKFMTNFDGHNAIGKAIYETIISSYGSSIVSLINNKLVLNQNQLLGIMMSISGLLLNSYYNNFPEQRRATTDVGRIAQLQQVLKQDGKNTETYFKINSFLQDLTKNPYIADDMAKLFEVDSILGAPDQSQDLSNLLDRYNQSKNKAQTIQDQIKNLMRTSASTNGTKAFKVVTVSNVYAEIARSLVYSTSGSILNRNTGSSGAKPDSLIGYITCDTDQMWSSPIAKGIVSEIHTLLSDYANSFKKTNDLEYYQTQYKNKEELIQKLKEKLQELRQITNELHDCFIIEDSAKQYEALYYNNTTGFHGGSLGPNLTDQLAKITMLANMGGFNQVDAEWLMMAVINSGPNMIGGAQKTSLENYLSFFATVLLFDDQINLVSEAMIDQPISSGTNVHTIHLFSTNNGTFPLSVVLQLTKDHLAQAFSYAEAEVLESYGQPHGKGAQVSITGYISEPSNTGYDADIWNNTVEEAKAKIKLKITFLTGFLNTLHNLFNIS